VERNIDTGELKDGLVPNSLMKIGGLMRHYREGTSLKKQSAQNRPHIIGRFAVHPVGSITTYQVRSTDVGKYRYERLAAITGITIYGEPSTLTHCFEVAKDCAKNQ
tara:strand:- start:70 stop:387 length:318 start_codon:yes stop_codon:yes gene_type:complete